MSGPGIEPTTSVQQPKHFTTRLLRRTKIHFGNWPLFLSFFCILKVCLTTSILFHGVLKRSVYVTTELKTWELRSDTNCYFFIIYFVFENRTVIFLAMVETTKNDGQNCTVGLLRPSPARQVSWGDPHWPRDLRFWINIYSKDLFINKRFLCELQANGVAGWVWEARFRLSYLGGSKTQSTNRP